MMIGECRYQTFDGDSHSNTHTQSRSQFIPSRERF